MYCVDAFAVFDLSRCTVSMYLLYLTSLDVCCASILYDVNLGHVEDLMCSLVSHEKINDQIDDVARKGLLQTI